jgi:hypothetical protein
MFERGADHVRQPGDGLNVGCFLEGVGSGGQLEEAHDLFVLQYGDRERGSLADA